MHAIKIMASCLGIDIRHGTGLETGYFSLISVDDPRLAGSPLLGGVRGQVECALFQVTTVRALLFELLKLCEQTRTQLQAKMASSDSISEKERQEVRQNVGVYGRTTV